jgi:hypothetical protein
MMTAYENTGSFGSGAWYGSISASSDRKNRKFNLHFKRFSRIGLPAQMIGLAESAGETQLCLEIPSLILTSRKLSSADPAIFCSLVCSEVTVPIGGTDDQRSMRGTISLDQISEFLDPVVRVSLWDIRVLEFRTRVERGIELMRLYGAI